MNIKSYKYSIAFSLVAGACIAFAGLVSAQPVVLTSFSVQAAPVQCPVVSSFMKQGISNDSVAVTRLQKFLKDSEKFDVEVNGSFDQKTEDAVKAFQKRYADSILTPWGATKASGIVYITTAKKINQLACREAMTLDQKELATISSYTAPTTEPTITEAVSAEPANSSVSQMQSPEADPVVTYPSDPDAVQSLPLPGPRLTATAYFAPGASLIAKFEYFLKNLF